MQDEEYRQKLDREAAHWAVEVLDVERLESMVPPALQRLLNADLTGDPDLHWFEDLQRRGPFGSVAELGANSGWLESRWLEAGASEMLDVYELSEGVLAKTRARLGERLLPRVRLIQTDLNHAELPRAHYDLIWCAGVLHHLVGLEHVFEQIVQALKPGGTLAFFEYVGEKRLQYEPERVRLCEEALRDVPDRFWRNGRGVKNADLDAIAPFEAVRSDEIYAVAAQRFRTVHWARTAVLSVAAFYSVDVLALAEERPDLLERLLAAERSSAASGLGGSLGYAVMRPYA